MNLKELIKTLSEGGKTPGNLDDYLDEFVPNVLLKNETLQKAFGVEDAEMEELYSRAYRFYEEENFGEAAVLFRWLVILNSFDVRYWMGLAACRQVLELYEKALHCYAMAALLAHEDPAPHYYAAYCYADLHDEENAAKARRLAYLRTQGKPLFKQMREELEASGCVCT